MSSYIITATILYSLQMEQNVDPGPVDKSVLVEQELHKSEAIFVGKVTVYRFSSSHIITAVDLFLLLPLRLKNTGIQTY